MKRYLTILAVLSCASSARACIDCTGTGSSVVFTGTVTAQHFVGPTITTMTDRIGALEGGGTTSYIHNQQLLQDGASFYVKLGSASAVSTSSITLRGVPYNPPEGDGSTGQALLTNGSGGLSWGSVAAGSGGGVSTFTVRLKIPGPLFLSTPTIFGIPGATWSPGFATATISEVSGRCVIGSTVGIGGLKIGYSSTTMPTTISPIFLWNGIHVATMTKSGDVATSPKQSSSSYVNSNTWLGVVVDTFSPVGQPPQDCEIDMRVWLNVGTGP